MSPIGKHRAEAAEHAKAALTATCAGDDESARLHALCAVGAMRSACALATTELAIAGPPHEMIADDLLDLLEHLTAPARVS